MLYVGSSNFAGWHIATAQSIAARRHFMGLVSEQSLYNLTARTIELEVIPACRHFGLGLIPWSPLGGGLLGGALQKASEGRRAERPACSSASRSTGAAGSLRGALPRAGRAARRCRAGLAAAATRSSPPRSSGRAPSEQLTGSLRALEIALGGRDAPQRLDEIWPGPGGEAPEAYAW